MSNAAVGQSLLFSGSDNDVRSPGEPLRVILLLSL